jgi:C-terminal processing protease CtpA/Prc
VAGGAAERGGQLRIGDVLLEIDGRDVHGLEGELVAGAMLGRAGSTVVLCVDRDGSRMVL